MGSHNVSHSVPEKIVSEQDLRKYWDSFIARQRIEHGTDAYNGTFSTTDGLVVNSTIFDSEAKADEFILDRTCKWEAAMAVKVRRPQINQRLIHDDEQRKKLEAQITDARVARNKVVNDVMLGFRDGAKMRSCSCCGSKVAMTWTTKEGAPAFFAEMNCPVCKKESILLKGEKVLIERAEAAIEKATKKFLDRCQWLKEKQEAKARVLEYWYVAGWAAC